MAPFIVERSNRFFRRWVVTIFIGDGIDRQHTFTRRGAWRLGERAVEEVTWGQAR